MQVLKKAGVANFPCIATPTIFKVKRSRATVVPVICRVSWIQYTKSAYATWNYHDTGSHKAIGYLNIKPPHR
jgi:hypothetical protein